MNPILSERGGKHRVSGQMRRRAAPLSELRSIRRANAMECPLLGGNYIASCTALKRVYVPSSFELGEYCRTNTHRICPFYLKAVEENRIVRARAVSIEPVAEQ